MRRLRFTRRAEEDLISLWQHVAGDAPIAADALLDRIEQRSRQLQFHPMSGRSRDDLLPGVRQLTIGNVLLFYRFDPNSIEIVRVLDGRRKIEAVDLEE